MKKIFLVALVMINSFSLFAQNKEDVIHAQAMTCIDQSKRIVDQKITDMKSTHVIDFVASTSLKPGTDTLFFGEEIWNDSEKNDAGIYLYRLMTAGLVYKVAVKLLLPSCEYVSATEHGQVE